MKGAGYLAGSRLLTLVSRLLYVLLVSTGLGPALYGDLTYGLSWYLVFLPIAGIGQTLRALMSVDVGRDQKAGAETVSQMLTLQLIAAGLGVVICAASAGVLENEPQIRQVIWAFTVALGARALATWCQQVFIAYEKTHLNLIQEALFRPLEVVLAALVLWQDGGAVELAMVHACVWVLQGVHGLFMVHFRMQPLTPHGVSQRLMGMLKRGFPLIIAALSITWIRQGPLVIFKHLPSQEGDLGQLALLLQALTYGGVVAVEAVAMAALPALSRAVAKGNRSDSGFLWGMLRLSAVIGPGAALVGWTLGAIMIPLLFGEAYLKTGLMLGDVMVLLIPLAVAMTCEHVLMARNRFRTVAVGELAGAIVMTVSMPALVSIFGLKGALYALGLGQILWAGLLLVASVKGSEADPHFSFGRLGLYIGLSLLPYMLWGTLYAWPTLLWGFLVLGLGAGPAGAIRRSEWRALSDILQKMAKKAKK